MSSIATANSGGIVVKAAQCIRDNKEYLSTIDGLIGDGDHGINMDKGAGIYLSRQSEAGEGLQENLKLLSRVLMNEIGGSMGPLRHLFRTSCQNRQGQGNLGSSLVLRYDGGGAGWNSEPRRG